MSQLKQTESRFSLTPTVVLVRSSTDWTRPTSIGEGHLLHSVRGFKRPSHPETLTDTPSVVFNQVPRYCLARKADTSHQSHVFSLRPQANWPGQLPLSESPLMFYPWAASLPTGRMSRCGARFCSLSISPHSCLARLPLGEPEGGLPLGPLSP